MSAVKHALLQAELKLRDSSWVYEMLAQRAAHGHGVSDMIGEEGESILFARSDPLINFGLARFGTTGKIVAQAFQLGGDLRIAALANHSINLRMDSFPAVLLAGSSPHLHPDLQSEADWLCSANENEMLALFSNPLVDDELASALIAARSPYASASRLQRIRAVWGLAENPALHAFRNNRRRNHVGWSTLRALWQLAESVEPDDTWAHALAQAYCHLELDERALLHPLDVATRWGSDSDRSLFRPRFLVRLHLARLALRQSNDLPNLLDSRDEAHRGAAYQSGSLNSNDVQRAIERDADFAVEHLAWNPQFWRSKSVRSAFLLSARTSSRACEMATARTSATSSGRLTRCSGSGVQAGLATNRPVKL